MLMLVHVPLEQHPVSSSLEQSIKTMIAAFGVPRSRRILGITVYYFEIDVQGMRRYLGTRDEHPFDQRIWF